MYSVLSSAVIPGVGIGVGYLATYHVTNLRRNGYNRLGPYHIIALIWQFVILPGNLIVAFYELPWTWALIVFPSALLGCLAGGWLASIAGDEDAAWIGPCIGLAIVGVKLSAHLGTH